MNNKILALIVYFIFNHLPIPAQQNYKLVKNLQVGDTTNAQPNNILVKPRIAICDNLGRIWIADEAILAIKVFDRNGNCIFTVGRRGQGPGEFQSITAMTVNRKGELVVVDYLSSRISRFNPLGKLMSTYPLPINEIQWPRKIACTNNGGYIMLGKHVKNDLIFHRFSEGLRYINSFGKLPIINSKNESFEVRFFDAEPGEITIDSQNILYYVPGFYNNKIYLYRGDSLFTILKGKVKINEPYEFKKLKKLKPGPPPTKYQYSMGGRGGFFYVRRNIASGGINIFEDGTIAHLLTLFKGQKFENWIEVFATDGTHIGLYRQITDEIEDYAWEASSGRWYLINRLGIPRVSEYILEKTN